METFIENMEQISKPEQRKIQTVVVKTREEAERIKQEIDSGKITMYQAAQNYSIDPTAKNNLGELGWVSQGTGFEGLDEFTFNLEPEVVGGPVETPAGWQLMKVLDVNDAQFQSLEDPQARKHTYRLYIKNRFDDYVVDLRKNHFKVAVFEDELNRQFQKEADYIAELTEKAKQKDSVTGKRIEEMQKWIEPPAVPTK
jgi:peptidyl-prolyl cis-trans isomerase C